MPAPTSSTATSIFTTPLAKSTSSLQAQSVTQATTQTPLPDLPFPSSFSSQDYTIHALTVISSSKIHAKVSQTLALLYSQPLSSALPLIALTTKSTVANKLISIVEIVKREVASPEENDDKKRRLYQYTTIKGVVTAGKQSRATNAGEGQRKRARQAEEIDGQAGAKKRKTEETQDHGAGSDAESEDAFVTQATPLPAISSGASAQRPVPYMTVFLSPVPIGQLRDAFGEQST